MAARGRPLRARYGRHVSQRGELWLPDGRAERPVRGWPVVAVLHGGFWRSVYGKRLMHGVCRDLAGRGWAAWNLEYRRIGAFSGGGWPETFDDVRDGIDHLASLADAHHLDLARLVTLGHSAGGHLALWAAARPKLGPPHRVPVTGAVALAGIADLEEAAAGSRGRGPVGALMGGAPDRWPIRYGLASPARLLPLGVPQVLVHGDADETVPLAMSRRYAERARAAGDDVTLVVVPGAGHRDLIRPGSEAWRATIGPLEGLAP